MAEATDKDSILSLFEPMDRDIRIAQWKHNPPAENPIPAANRREVIDWLLSREGGGVTVKLFHPFDNPEVRDILVENMLLNSWFLPDPELANRLPLRGQSTRHIGSSSIPLDLPQEMRKADVVIKPSMRKNKGEHELQNLQKARDRGIPTVEPLGIINIRDTSGRDTYVLTLLRRGILPLEKINFEQLHLEPKGKFQQLTDLLRSLGEFVANMHNNGVAHGDLHLGNIAVDLDQESEFVLIDLERAKILGLDKLNLKNKVDRKYSESLEKGFEDFERAAIEDLVRIGAEITGRNSQIRQEVIWEHLIQTYLENRTPSRGQPSREEFESMYKSLFAARHERVRHAVDWVRNQHPDILN